MMRHWPLFDFVALLVLVALTGAATAMLPVVLHADLQPPAPVGHSDDIDWSGYNTGSVITGSGTLNSYGRYAPYMPYTPPAGTKRFRDLKVYDGGVDGGGIGCAGLILEHKSGVMALNSSCKVFNTLVRSIEVDGVQVWP